MSFTDWRIYVLIAGGLVWGALLNRGLMFLL